MQMPGRVAGKVAFITGAGRGQGRSHTIRLTEENTDIIATNILKNYPTIHYEMSSQADLDETIRAVEALGRKIVAAKADVRDTATLRAPWTPAWHSWAGSTSSAPTPGSTPCSRGTRSPRRCGRTPSTRT
jgi:hypothetical protein